MKIRQFTHAESVEIKQDLSNRVVLAKEIHELYIQRVHESYKTYVRDFKYSIWSPFTFKAVSEDKFLNGFFGKYGGMSIATVKKVTRYVGGTEFLYVYGYGYDSKYVFTNKVDCQLERLAYRAREQIIRNDEALDYCSILMDYAEFPYELNFSDMEKIRQYRAQYHSMATEFQEIKNELHSNK